MLRSISVPLCVRKFIQCRGFLSVSLLLVLYCVSMGARHIKEHIWKPKADQWESVFSAKKKEKKKLKASLQRPSVYSRVLLGQPNSTPGQLDFWKTPCWKWQIETKTYTVFYSLSWIHENIMQTRLLRCEDLQLFFILRHSTANLFNLWITDCCNWQRPWN